MSGQTGFPYHYAPSVLALAISMSVIDIGVVILRVITRKRQAARFGIDDYLVVISLIATLGVAATAIAGTARGAVGYPTPAINFHNPQSISVNTEAHRITNQLRASIQAIDLCCSAKIVQCQLATYITSTIALGFIKLAFLFFLRRVFCVPGPRFSGFSLASWVIITLVAGWTLSFFIAWTTACGSDMPAFWGSFSELLAKCPGSIHILIAQSISDVILDCIVVLLPLPMIWKLHLSIRKKFVVTSVFCIGLVVVTASVLRLAIVLRSRQVGGVDQDLYITNVIWWTVFETTFALLGSCLSSLLPLLVDLSASKVIQSLRSRLSTLSGSNDRSSDLDRRSYHPDARSRSLANTEIEMQKSASFSHRGMHTTEHRIEEQSIQSSSQQSC